MPQTPQHQTVGRAGPYLLFASGAGRRTIPSRAAAACLLGVLCLGGACGNPTQPANGPDDTPPCCGGPPVASFGLAGPGEVLVNDHATLAVTASDAQDHALSTVGRVAFTSSDPTVLRVWENGAVQGLRRGSATITARMGGVTSAITIHVIARVVVLQDGPGYWLDWPGYWPMAIGDTLRFRAVYEDVNGLQLADQPESPVWSSSAPDRARVDSSGRVSALALSNSLIDISARTADGVGSTSVLVPDYDSGPPATIRFAHAAKGMGPITFVPSKGDSVTLAYGEFVDREIRPGPIEVHVDGLPIGEYQVLGGSSMYPGFIEPDRRLALYLVGGPGGASVAHVPSYATNVSVDSGLVRIVPGATEFPSVLLRPSGAPPSGSCDLCYFGGDVSTYFSRPAGTFDLLVGTRYPSDQFVRLPATAIAGRAVTLVLTGSTASDVGLLAFPDP